MLNVPVEGTETEMGFDIPDILPGIYIIMLINNGEVLATNKFIKR